MQPTAQALSEKIFAVIDRASYSVPRWKSTFYDDFFLQCSIPSSNVFRVSPEGTCIKVTPGEDGSMNSSFNVAME
jgi:hypothetical protein